MEENETTDRAKWNQAAREAYHKEHPENFAGEGDSFPIKDGSDVADAWGLAGHADNPDAVRAKIKAIAKRLGLEGSLPDTAKEDSKQERAMNTEEPTIEQTPEDRTAPEEKQERATPEAITPESLAVYMPITRFDATSREVFGQATVEQPDSYGTIFGFYPEAWTKWRGNMREQHDPKKAVGKAFKVEADEKERAIYVTSKVSRGAQDTWLKIEDGVLSGYSASIIPDPEYGPDPRRWPRKEYNGKQYPWLPRYTVAELSYVDNPATPGCNIQIVRADGFATEVLDLEEEPTPEPQPTPDPEQTETLERAGARMSNSSRATLHDMRDKAMALCGCDECKGMAAGPAERSVNAEMEQMVTDLVERALIPVYARLQGIAGTLARSNAPLDTSSLENLMTSAISRAVESATAAHESSLGEVRSALAEVKGQVDRIAETPVPGAPIMNAGALPRPVEKRLPTDPYEAPARSGSSVYDAVATLSNAGHLDTIDKQVDALAAAFSMTGPQRRR